MGTGPDPEPCGWWGVTAAYSHGDPRDKKLELLTKGPITSNGGHTEGRHTATRLNPHPNDKDNTAFSW